MSKAAEDLINKMFGAVTGKDQYGLPIQSAQKPSPAADIAARLGLSDENAMRWSLQVIRKALDTIKAGGSVEFTDASGKRVKLKLPGASR